MANVKPVIQIELDPLRPVPEICAVMAAVMPYHPNQEEAILIGVKEAIDRKLTLLKGAEASEPIRQPDTEQENQ